MNAYSTVLTDRAGEPQHRLEACSAIRTSALAGDCALVVARQAEDSNPGTMKDLCPLVPAGTWRHECWFELAEATRQRDPALAVSYCGHAGPFAPDCRQHLWQSLLWRIARSPGGLEKNLGKAEALGRRWTRLLSDDPEFEQRFWRQFYRASLTGSPPVDPARCQPLAVPHRSRCIEAARSILEELPGPLQQRDAG